MPYLRDRVIVLKKEPFREQDRRYVMYGREHGLLVAVARGASSPRSKQAGHLEPFSEAEVMIAKGVAFDKLAVAKIFTPYALRATPLAAVVIAGAFADLVIKLTRQGIADERIFLLLQDVIETLAAMPEIPSPERARLIYAAATLRLLDLVGFAPDVGAHRDAPLLKFMRHAPLADVLRVTAPRDTLNAASALVEDALKHTPLEAEPHGARTIQATIG